MYKIFTSKESGIVRINDIEDGCWIAMTAPTAEELHTISNMCKVAPEDLRAALDEEERSRILVEDDYTLIIVDIPTIEERNEKDWYVTIPLGVIITDNHIITVCLEDTPVLTGLMDGRVKNFYTYKKTRFILQILYRNATLFLSYLRNIDKRSEAVEQRLQQAQKNRELIELQELEKSLVYFTTSLKANEIVLEKLFRLDKIKKYPEDEDLLEDVIVENKQAIEMANIYSGILSGTMGTFASIISNNLNVSMKFLATVTIVLSIPTMVASFYGMNVSTVGMPFANSEWGFFIVIGFSILLSIIVSLIFWKKNLF